MPCIVSCEVEADLMTFWPLLARMLDLWAVLHGSEKL